MKNTASSQNPVCCGKEMEVRTHIGPFLVARCSVCGDSVYIKSGSTEKPQMISD
ncbi:MAG: hypothetical protein ABIG30_01205 [Candidatus Aenigmatarchaeota archaeon]